MQCGSPSSRAVQINVAAEGLHSVLHPQKAGAAGKFGAPDAVVGHLSRSAPSTSSASTLTLTSDAPECLAALVNASATM